MRKIASQVKLVVITTCLLQIICEILGNPCNSLEPAEIAANNYSVQLTDGVSYHRSMCFTRDQAETYCQSQGYGLVRIESEDTWNNIRQQLSALSDSGINIDIDIYVDQHLADSRLVYTDGTPAYYFRTKDGLEECFYMEIKAGLKPRTDRCDKTYASLCEATGEPKLYNLIREPMTWQEAKESCNTTGGLAPVSSVSQYANVSQTLSDAHSAYGDFNAWIGLRITTNGSIQIADGTPTNFYPDDKHDNGCISMDVSSNFHFKTGPCQEKRDFICQTFGYTGTTQRAQSTSRKEQSTYVATLSTIGQNDDASSESTTMEDTSVSTGSLRPSSLSETTRTEVISTEFTTNSQPLTSGVSPQTDLSTSGQTVSLTSSSSACFSKGFLFQEACMCSNNITSAEELERKLDELRSILKIEKKTLSSTRRQKECAEDNRPSAVFTGSIGCVVLAGLVLLIVGPDVASLILHLRKKYCHACGRNGIKICK